MAGALPAMERYPIRPGVDYNVQVLPAILEYVVPELGWR
jgi:hypothetical protein